MGANKPVVFLAGLLLATVLGAATANENVVSTINEGEITPRCQCVQTLSDLVQQQSATIDALHLAVQQQGATIKALQLSVQVLHTSRQSCTLPTDTRQPSQTGLDDVTTRLDDVTTILDDVTTRLDNVTTRLDDVTTGLDDVNASVTSQVTAVRNRMDSRARSMQVAFSAHMATSYSVAVGADSPIVFSVVVTNLGGAYNPDTGVFTAPNAGLYVFHFAVINDGAADTIHVALYKNGQVLSVSTAEGIGEYNKYDDATALVTIHLDQGDRVYAQRRGGGTRLYGGEFCNFSGFLLALDETA